MPQNKIEKRFIEYSRSGIELREIGNSSIISGLASVFYSPANEKTEYQLWDNVYERIDPSAFDNALKNGDDVRALFNHNSDLILGRSTSGTLKLFTDAVGLRYEITLPDTQTARDLKESISRGDITGSSFGFIAKKIEWIDEGTKEIRVIKDLELLDVSPVTYPAYEATDVVARSKDIIKRDKIILVDIEYSNAVIKTLKRR